MINLTRGSVNTFYFTASELKTIASPFFLFVCKSRQTNDVVKFFPTSVSSDERKDTASVNPDVVFDNMPDGFWEYTIYQKSNETDETESGVILERGYINLQPSGNFSYITPANEPDNKFIQP